jgi:hypothetical protein
MNAGKALAIGAALTAMLAVSISLWLNPPAENRARALDLERMRRLKFVELAVDKYFVDHQTLPRSLDALDAEKNQLVFQNWHDPDSDQPFSYEVTGDTSYRLCANFARSSENQSSQYDKHKAGPDCFDVKTKAAVRR